MRAASIASHCNDSHGLCSWIAVRVGDLPDIRFGEISYVEVSIGPKRHAIWLKSGHIRQGNHGLRSAHQSSRYWIIGQAPVCGALGRVIWNVNVVSSIGIGTRIINRLPGRTDAAVITDCVVDGVQRGAWDKVLPAETIYMI